MVQSHLTKAHMHIHMSVYYWNNLRRVFVASLLIEVRMFKLSSLLLNFIYDYFS